ncbi:hypothetical protein G3N59_11670 [Paraburkholderia sp. Ac-20340]|uniref:hypothetical protein n=1 Tax=Paraburkholderia sp. Ac-20340 TaxID=2703888 RepID=UPI00197DBFC8|nr:hypothetical protein [Paraburkholderia sp. Ac-20340]MBN3854038.1 hypothetical protein [Paraburkholderia sp. Ac-20340]
MSSDRFRRKFGLSHARLQDMERRGELFSVPIGNNRYFPAVLADKSLDRHRLRKLLQRLPPAMPSMEKYLLLVSRRGSLADKSPLQSTRRAKRYRIALRVADAEADAT